MTWPEIVFLGVVSIPFLTLAFCLVLLAYQLRKTELPECPEILPPPPKGGSGEFDSEAIDKFEKQLIHMEPGQIVPIPSHYHISQVDPLIEKAAEDVKKRMGYMSEAEVKRKFGIHDEGYEVVNSPAIKPPIDDLQEFCQTVRNQIGHKLGIKSVRPKKEYPEYNPKKIENKGR